MNREQFFQELRTALHREGFTPQPEQDELLPVGWDGLPLCRITADGGVRYWQEDVATPERERACERATDLACTVREYMTPVSYTHLDVYKRQGPSHSGRRFLCRPPSNRYRAGPAEVHTGKRSSKYPVRKQ